MSKKIIEIIEMLEQIYNDESIPKNVKLRIETTLNILNQKQELPVRINESLQELDELNNDPNIPQYIRTQLWGIVSNLESI